VLHHTIIQVQPALFNQLNDTYSRNSHDDRSQQEGSAGRDRVAAVNWLLVRGGERD